MLVLQRYLMMYESRAPKSAWRRAGGSVWRGWRRLLRRALGARETHWVRVVMNRETERFVRSLDRAQLDAIELSGERWQEFGFASYRSVGLPDYDVCDGPLEKAAFDLIIAEQVLEHVLRPHRAVRHVWEMLRPGGTFVATTPFLLRVHDHPVDCSRWTELGLKHLLAEGGFRLGDIATGSWGNRAAVRANLGEWREWIPWLHSLRNEPDYPVVVWAFARKSGGESI
jgi:SAM-dependent methyltransferase